MQYATFAEKARQNQLPIQYKIFKGMTGKFGAMRFTLKRPYTGDDFSKPEGCVFMDMAPATGSNVYDWQNQKITIALSVTDISKIILFLRNPTNSLFLTKDKNSYECNLFHDTNAGTTGRPQNTKSLRITKPEDRTNYFFSLAHNKNGSRVSATVPISPDEAIVLGVLLQSAIPIIMSWTDYKEQSV